MDEPSFGDVSFDADGLPVVMAKATLRHVAGVHIEWFGFLSARPTGCRVE